MLYELLYPLRDVFFGFNVFRYITFRAIMASVFSFFICLVLGPYLIRLLGTLNMRHRIERDGFDSISEQSRHKEATPTMGGLLMLGAVTFSTVLWCDLRNVYVWMALSAFLWLGVIGFADDYLKLAYNNAKGLQAMTKFTGQMTLGLIVGWVVYRHFHWESMHIPFLKDFAVPLGPLYILFVCLVLVGTSNAVNLTDGLDGLAIGCTMFIALAYAVLSYITGHAIFSDYLQTPFILGAGELTIFCMSIVGASMGFLWFNSYPASIFMGDTGSLSLGGAIGIVAIATKKEILLLIIGGVFVIEALSVILQVTSFKMRRKRIFLMAPLHHHFQLKGWPESKIVIRFWILSVMLAMFAMTSLKLR